MADHSQKWHNGTSTRIRSTETSDGLVVIQAQLNNLGREIKKVNERVYVAQVVCESFDRPHYTKDSPLKEEGKTLEEAYYTQFRVPFPQGGRYRAAAPGFYQRDSGNPSYQERRQTMKESLSKFMVESAKRHDENSNLIKEIRAATDAAIRNQGAVMAEARSQQVASMIEFHWLGHRLPISTTKTWVAILKAQDMEKELEDRMEGTLPIEKRLVIFGKKIAYHEARASIHDDLMKKYVIKDYLSGLDNVIDALLGKWTIERNQLLVSIAKSKLGKSLDEKNEKVTKPEEFVRLCDLLQNISDLSDFYDDKILDGFYDLYETSTTRPLLLDMPSLLYLQRTSISDNITWEAVVVNKAADSKLLQLLEQSAKLTSESIG
ncbi:DNA-directed DNA polymerase [Tanacetum coccineum]|uniref:DNA-directed DNA polymerase n=1 Tax=Tanacetum coccineum TaxID=301880 RepID=A0ABQ4ZDF6_9ASTR